VSALAPVVAPVTRPLAIASGVASAAPGIYGKLKWIVKTAKRTLGKNRKENATQLYYLAKAGHETSISFMIDIGVLQSGERPSPEAKGYYKDDLKNPMKESQIIDYIMQKMRS
jgi:hypothetical protein